MASDTVARRSVSPGPARKDTGRRPARKDTGRRPARKETGRRPGTWLAPAPGWPAARFAVIAWICAALALVQLLRNRAISVRRNLTYAPAALRWRTQGSMPHCGQSYLGTLFGGAREAGRTVHCGGHKRRDRDLAADPAAPSRPPDGCSVAGSTLEYGMPPTGASEWGWTDS